MTTLKINSQPCRVAPVEPTSDHCVGARWNAAAQNDVAFYRAMLTASDPALAAAVVEMRNLLAIIEARVAPDLLVQQAGDDDICDRIEAALARITVEADDDH